MVRSRHKPQVILRSIDADDSLSTGAQGMEANRYGFRGEIPETLTLGK